MPPAFHAIVVSLITGLFFFALIAVLVRLAIQWRGSDPRSRLAVGADQGALWSASIGTLLILGAVITGFAIWAPSAAINSPVMRNKILTALLLLVTYAIFVAIRWRFGERLWENKALSAFYAMVAIAGFHWSMVTNSIGGDIAGIPSGYETIVQLSGVETRFTYYLPTWVLITIVVISVAMLALAYLGGTPEETSENENAGLDART
ncbi:MAG: hypothetical protein JJT89_02340 [Nitriliruptoraceae bacterium]|nr:hypothetical protein [Nitriliruptoraceae bacterium]